MADLDNFFAKKDKKKKKGKEKKFPKTTSTSMVKSLEATETPPDKQENEVKFDLPTGPSQDDEWHEHEEETQDLEGLKVQALRLDGDEKPQMRNDAKEAGYDAEEDDDGSEERKLAASSAWQKKKISTPIVTEAVSEPPPADKTTVGGVYIPPSRRQGTSGGGRRAPHLPPDIQNASAFPSLQASVQTPGKERPLDKDFKEVKSYKGGRSDPTYEAPSLELTNKYSSLGNN